MRQRHMPLGYRMAGGKILIVLEQAELMKEVFQTYSEGGSLYRLARRLAEQGGSMQTIGRCGTMGRLEKSWRMKSTSGMRSCRKPVQWITLRKSGCRITALFHSIMWRTVMSRLSSVTFICRCRRRWCGGRTCTVRKNERSRVTAASTLCPALFTARNMGGFTVESHGITGANTL